MPEPLLRLEEVSPANQIGGDGMSKPVEADALQTSLVPKFREPVAESAGGQAPSHGPGPWRTAIHRIRSCRRLVAARPPPDPPQLDRRPSQRQPAHLPGLGRANLFP